MTYVAETRAETSRTKQLIRTVEMNTLRAIVGKTRLDRVRNSTVREQCGVQDVSKFVKVRRKAWNEHVSRARDTRLIKIVRNNKPEGKISRNAVKEMGINLGIYFNRRFLMKVV